MSAYTYHDPIQTPILIERICANRRHVSNELPYSRTFRIQPLARVVRLLVGLPFALAERTSSLRGFFFVASSAPCVAALVLFDSFGFRLLVDGVFLPAGGACALFPSPEAVGTALL